VNEPVSVVDELKHGDWVVKVKLATFNVLPLPWVNEVVKPMSCDPVRVALQLPLMLPELEFPPPQAIRVTARPSKMTPAKYFIENSLWVQNPLCAEKLRSQR
jgi:hypothetical protein